MEKRTKSSLRNKLTPTQEALKERLEEQDKRKAGKKKKPIEDIARKSAGV